MMTTHAREAIEAMPLTFDTAFCRLLGVPLPIVQAPIGGLATPGLAAAASEAGALGMLALTWAEPEDIDTKLAEMRERTERPFGVNLIVRIEQEERLRRCLDQGVRLFSFFWGDPSALIPIAHQGGALVMHTVGSAEEARRAVDAGVDIVVAQGWEAGGHVWGGVATMALVPAVVDAVGNGIPVIAAGGIADGRGLAAVLTLGASAGWLGTRFAASTEAQSHPRYRELLLAAAETSTYHGTVFDGGWPDAPHRTLRNRTIEAWLDAGSPPSGRRPGEGEVLATDAGGKEVLRYQSTSPREELSGDIDALSLWAGQSVGLVHEILPVREIVGRIAAEAAAVLEREAASVRR
jgi:NAD(P)H-dependent flavin oxidoreductase YrpB (nitropropane dioxygenase family)